ncbi:hypothetical protein [Photorhabdus luminescens]|uniref:Uncharacterized protein n=1 Tax=Photorhabdus luminescens subsp. mexicana TaxID=2100167 RepID=A0A4V2X5G7_PHOLU|nr:hypothetical protein [Photorhabdus luminescens]TDB48055.1 hypothetical protein C5468_16760 [Photorhabdus luminescens subsp. mexicana]
MNISKSTINFANRRNIDIEMINIDGADVVWFSQIEDGEVSGEPMFVMFNNQNNLTWKGNIYLPQVIKEEIPATILSEKQLKEMIKFLKKELPDACM